LTQRKLYALQLAKLIVTYCNACYAHSIDIILIDRYLSKALQ